MTTDQSGLQIADRLEILDLYARQAHLIDGGDAAGWAATFTDQGVFESPTYRLTAVGRAELARFAADSNGAAWARGEQLRHWLDQVVVDRTPEGAQVRAYLLIVATSSTTGTSRIDRSLRVTDELVQVDGRWLLASRRVLRDDDRSLWPHAAARYPENTSEKTCDT
jgi:hypothetical protein